MVYTKVLGIALLASLASSEPPVQGYNYRRPSFQNSYTAPSNQYIPPSSGFTAPSNNYLPPTSFGEHGSHNNHGSQYSGHDSYDNGHNHGHDNEVPKSYEFGYSVKDAASGNDYGRKESSDGNVVRGEYRVQLPDGRTQIVTYHADWQTGFHADVRYEGEAHYPEPTHNANNQGYNYNAPGFSGSLTGFGNRDSYKPSTSYNPPSTSYGPPSTSYGPPSTSYGPPGYH